MRKEYTKPNMTIVSLKTENIAVETTSANQTANFASLNYASKTVTYY